MKCIFNHNAAEWSVSIFHSFKAEIANIIPALNDKNITIYGKKTPFKLKKNE